MEPIVKTPIELGNVCLHSGSRLTLGKSRKDRVEFKGKKSWFRSTTGRPNQKLDHEDCVEIRKHVLCQITENATKVQTNHEETEF